jgi:hypothetical protein
MNPRIRAELPALVYPLLMGSAIATIGASFLRDPSGLHLILLEPAKWLAISAFILLVVLRIWTAVDWGSFLLAIACYLAADLPHLTGLEYKRALMNYAFGPLGVVSLLITGALYIRSCHRISLAWKEQRERCPVCNDGNSCVYGSGHQGAHVCKNKGHKWY